MTTCIMTLVVGNMGRETITGEALTSIRWALQYDRLGVIQAGYFILRIVQSQKVIWHSCEGCTDNYPNSVAVHDSSHQQRC